ncbi:MAG: TIGR02530 family flagellar biosynthesis protein [Lachnospiraceae bacterium]
MMGINRLHNLTYEAAVTVNKPVGAGAAKGEPVFETLFEGKLKDSLNFSKHAAKRMDERGIEVDNQLLENLEHAVADRSDVGRTEKDVSPDAGRASGKTAERENNYVKSNGFSSGRAARTSK